MLKMKKSIILATIALTMTIQSIESRETVCEPYDLGTGYSYVESTCTPAYARAQVIGAVLATVGIAALIIAAMNGHGGHVH